MTDLTDYYYIVHVSQIDKNIVKYIKRSHLVILKNEFLTIRLHGKIYKL